MFAPGPPTTASHIELSPCGKFAYVSNRVGVDIDGGCAACAEGAISVISVRVPSVPYPCDIPLLLCLVHKIWWLALV